MADPIDEETTVSRGVLYRGDRTSSTELADKREAEEDKLKKALGWDTVRWPYTDYDGNEI